MSHYQPAGGSRSICDTLQIISALNLFFCEGHVTELRALDAKRHGDYRLATLSGYFDNPNDLAQEVSKIEHAKGIYFVPNEVNPALLARSVNRAKVVYREPTTSDADILSRRFLLVDCDPIRPAGISSSEAEHNAAITRAYAISNSLSQDGWPAPSIADSGNGAHLMYRIDLPANDGGVVQNCLKALAARFNADGIAVDETVHNPARIWKLPGTLTAKGDCTADRPHRIARILWHPPQLAVVNEDQLAALARHAPTATIRATSPAARTQNEAGTFDLATWITANNLNVTGPDRWQGGQRWVFRVCPWNDAHSDRSAFLVQLPSGAIAAGCQHAGCADKNWHALRDIVEPGWRDRRAGRQRDIGPPGAPPAIRLAFTKRNKRG